MKNETYFEFPYDWRRDNRIAARALRDFIRDRLDLRRAAGFSDAKAIFVAHSMGALVARHYLEVLGGWERARALFCIGAPLRGSMNALAVLANGFRASLGPIRLLDLTHVVRSFDSVHQLLPTYRCIEGSPGTHAPARLTELSHLPNVDLGRVCAAADFHQEIADAVQRNVTDAARANASRYSTHPIVGIGQSTFASASVTASGVELRRTLEGKPIDGDGTVSRLSATPDELRHERREHYATEKHASLQNVGDVLEQIAGLGTTLEIEIDRYRASVTLDPSDRLPARLGYLTLDLDDVFESDATIPISATARTPSGELFDSDLDVTAWLVEIELCTTHAVSLTRDEDGVYGAFVGPLEPGAYRVSLHAAGLDAVSDVILVYRAGAPTTSGEETLPLRWIDVAEEFDAAATYIEVRSVLKGLPPQAALVLNDGERRFAFRAHEVRAVADTGDRSKPLRDLLRLAHEETATTTTLHATGRGLVSIFGRPPDPVRPWLSRLLRQNADGRFSMAEP
ncbi:MAG: hypothetical protein IPJ34_13145 [Myxococcales bacterium]|nr:hypothetical protein [Myxococcales bacterium]